jgi:hypothetical protein
MKIQAQAYKYMGQTLRTAAAQAGKLGTLAETGTAWAESIGIVAEIASDFNVVAGVMNVITLQGDQGPGARPIAYPPPSQPGTVSTQEPDGSVTVTSTDGTSMTIGPPQNGTIVAKPDYGFTFSPDTGGISFDVGAPDAGDVYGGADGGGPGRPIMK